MIIVINSTRRVIHFFNVAFSQFIDIIKHFIEFDNIFVESFNFFDENNDLKNTFSMIFYNVNKFKNEMMIFFFKNDKIFDYEMIVIQKF